MANIFTWLNVNACDFQAHWPTTLALTLLTQLNLITHRWEFTVVKKHSWQAACCIHSIGAVPRRCDHFQPCQGRLNLCGCLYPTATTSPRTTAVAHLANIFCRKKGEYYNYPRKTNTVAASLYDDCSLNIISTLRLPLSQLLHTRYKYVGGLNTQMAFHLGTWKYSGIFLSSALIGYL